ncbi:MAG: HAMP domain-containing histidine kinase [Actinomycetota bacterium]|nr:HAMP domain-containing histidine kinase [Actinomycetota bacterium]
MDDVRFAEMISKIAHELRSPLTSVKGFSSTLVSRWDRFTDEQRRQLVETIHSDAERMARIVSEVLDLARLEANRLELNLQRVELRELVDKSVTSQSELVAGAARVTVGIAEDVTAWADPERLTHVISNLIENAIKFSDDGPIEITAEHTTEGSTLVQVRDRGVGIPPEILPHIFQGPASTAQKATPSGSGLGLYLSRRLVEAHGGTIQVVSEERSGSTFSVTLPAREARVEP